MYSYFLFTLIPFNAFYYVTEASLEEVEILKILLDSKIYNKNILPSSRNGTALEIKIGIALFTVAEINSKEGYMKSTIWYRIAWTDSRLKTDTVNAQKHITVLRVSESSVWKPSILLTNTFEKERVLVDDKVLIYPETGHVLWIPHTTVKTVCNVDLYYFPFDQQTCSYRVMDLGHTTEEVNLTFYLDKKHMDMSRYWNSTYWTFVSSEVSKTTVKPSIDSKLEAGVETLNFDLTFQRVGRVYMTTLLVPAFLLSFISLLTFVVPAESNEKLILGFVSLASVLVLLIEVTNAVPAAQKLPLITKFLMFVLIVNVLTLAATSIVLHVTTKESDVPKWMKRWILQLQKLLRISSSSPQKEGAGSETQPRNDAELDDIPTPAETSILSALQRKQILNEKLESWKKAGVILDRCFLLVFTITTVIGIAAYLGTTGIGINLNESLALKRHI